MNLSSPTSTPMGAFFFLEYRCPFSSAGSLSKIAIPQNTCANRARAQILSVNEIYGAFVKLCRFSVEQQEWQWSPVLMFICEAKPQQSVVSVWRWGRCQLRVTLPSLARASSSRTEHRKALIWATSFLCAARAGTNVVTHRRSLK